MVSSLLSSDTEYGGSTSVPVIQHCRMSFAIATGENRMQVRSYSVSSSLRVSGDVGQSWDYGTPRAASKRLNRDPIARSSSQIALSGTDQSLGHSDSST